MAYAWLARTTANVVMKNQFGRSSLMQVRYGHVKGYWNPDWRADPKIPKTPEERAAAARKYGLQPEDYKPSSEDDALPVGDYPDLPIISYAERNPYEAWDDPGLRRNFGEPLRIDFDMYTGDRCDTRRERNTMTYMVSTFIAVFMFFIGVGMATRGQQTFQPQMPKQYPYNDLWIAKGGDPAKEPKIVNYAFPSGPHDWKPGHH